MQDIDNESSELTGSTKGMRRLGKTTAGALKIEAVEIDATCIGDRWQAQDIDRLARLIAIIALGQALHAAKIILELSVESPVITKSIVRSSAKRQLQISGSNEEKLKASRWRRDGFLFEAVSWIAARQAHGDAVLLNDPHLKSTTQGLDGLMIEWDPAKGEVLEATIREDKCSGSPRGMFRDEVLPAFRDHHQNLRAPELISIAASMIKSTGIDGTRATEAAERVLDLAYRSYRAALAITSSDDSVARRKAVFKGYDGLGGLDPHQRIGATFVVDGEMRDYFERLADAALSAIDAWGDVDV